MKVHYESVFDALYSQDPEKAASAKLRSEAALAIFRALKARDVPQKQLADELRITQGRLSNLMQGRLSKFKLDWLVDLAARAGVSLSLVASAAPAQPVRPATRAVKKRRPALAAVSPRKRAA